MTKEDMKKTYMKPAAEAMNLGLKGEDIAEGIDITTSTAVSRDADDKIDGGDVLVKDGGVWNTDGLWN